MKVFLLLPYLLASLQFAFVLILAPKIHARILSHCELAREMYKLGVAQQDLPTWACIARYESKMNTSAIGLLNGNWSTNFGIFQISDRFWCVSSPTRRSEDKCHMDCRRLLNNNLRDTVKCALTVKQQQGWQAWAVYRGLCSKQQRLQSIKECF